MNRLFNTFLGQPGATGVPQPGSRRWMPALDLVETADHYLVRVDLPGVSERDVTIQLEGNVLTIAGQRTLEHTPGAKQGDYRLERAFGAFSRSLTLPDGVDPNQAGAQFKRGVLEITIPKPEQRKPRRVQISLEPAAGDPAPIESANVDNSESESSDAELVSTI